MRSSLKPTGGTDIVEIAQVIADSDVVEHAAEAAEGHAHAIGAACAAELTAALEMRFQI